MQKRYKFLRLVEGKIKSDSGNLTWKVGQWQEVGGTELDLCNHGLHASKEIYQAFSFVQGEVLAEVEVSGRHVGDDEKEAWERMRILRAWKWQKKDSLALAIYAAELVLKNYEKKCPGDLRPRQAIEAAKKVLFKDTAANREAAYSAARRTRGHCARGHF